MKYLRLSLLFVLALCLVLSISPSAFAAEEGSCGPNATWRFEDGTLTISGTGPVTEISIHEFKDQVKHVIVEPGIISLPDHAFYNWPLHDITLPEGLTTIGYGVFSGCSNLTAIKLPTTLTKIGSSAFRDSGLTGITIPDGITQLESMVFMDCSRLLRVTLPEGLTEIGTYAFQNCIKLSAISLPNSLKAIGNGAFMGCTVLESIVLPEFVTIVPGAAFYGCESLKSVTLSPQTTQISNEAFHKCSALLSITIPATANVIRGLPITLQEIHISDLTAWCQATHDSVFHCLRNAKLFLNGELIIDLVIPAGCEQIGAHAFHDYAYLKSVTIPEGVTGIAWCAFNGCQNLQQITLPHSLEAIGPNVFQNCSSLTQVTYLGTAEDFPNLLIGEHNDSLLAASWNFGPLGTALIVIDALRMELLIVCLIGSGVLIACLVIYIRQKKYPFL